MVIGIIIAIKQLKLMKEDIETKNNRAAVEKSIEFLSWFATEFLPEVTKVENKLDNSKLLILQNKKFKEFTIKELTSFVDFDREKFESSIKEKHKEEFIALVNQLEFFSAAMTSGLADEKVAFPSLSKTYIEFLEDNYDLYCYYRYKNEGTLFIHSIKLYEIWKSRADKMDLVKKRQEIDNEISQINTSDIPIIGGRK